jgi:hypothetical protein
MQPKELLQVMLQVKLQVLVLDSPPEVCLVISMQELMLVQEEMLLILLYKEIRSSDCFMYLSDVLCMEFHLYAMLPEMFKTIL